MKISVARNAINPITKKACKCIVCRRHHEVMYRIEGMKGYASEGFARFVCNEDLMPKAYHHTRRENIIGEDNITWWRVGDVSCELEVISPMYGAGSYNVKKALGLVEGYPMDEAFTSVYIGLILLGSSSNHGQGQNTEADCTVTAEGHARFRSIEGLSTFLRNLSEEELKCFNNSSCGAHIHANISPLALSKVRYETFEALFNRIMNMSSEDRLNYFGSDFRHYASTSLGYHGDCINWHTSHNTVEFRLPRVRTAEQYVQCVKFWRACIDILNRNEAKSWTAEQYGRKLAKQVDRLENGAFSKGK